MKAISKICSALLLVGFGSAAQATDCTQWSQFSSFEGYLEPLSVPAEEIGAHLTASQWSEGIEFNSKRHGNEIWLDITAYPGDTTAAGGNRALMMVGRLMDDDFERLILEDDNKPLFALSEPDLRSIGCRFIWGRAGGENSIALMRELYKAMTWYEDDRPISAQWNGSLMGDTNLAVTLSTQVLLPEWALSALVE